MLDYGLRAVRHPAPPRALGRLEPAVRPRTRAACQGAGLRLAAELDLHGAHRLSVHAVRLHQRRVPLHARRRIRIGIDLNATGGDGDGQSERVQPARPDAAAAVRRRLRASDHREQRLRPVSRRHDRAQRVPRPGLLERRLRPEQARPLRHARRAAPARGLQPVQPRQYVSRTRTRPTSSSFTAITGYREGNRRLQLGFKFEF